MNANSSPQTDLRFLLPLYPGQRVAIMGIYPQIAATLHADNIYPMLVSHIDDALMEDETKSTRVHVKARYSSLPFATGSLDHVFVPRYVQSHRAWIIEEISRVLKPEGWLFIGFLNANRLDRFGNSGTQVGGRQNNTLYPLSIRTCRMFLEKSGFQVKGSFGVHDNLSNPRFFVPLERPAMAYHFFRKIFVPYSLKAEISRRIAIFLSRIGLQRVLFKNVVVIAQRRERKVERYAL